MEVFGGLYAGLGECRWLVPALGVFGLIPRGKIHSGWVARTRCSSRAKIPIDWMVSLGLAIGAR